jgi:hypothetical protein
MTAFATPIILTASPDLRAVAAHFDQAGEGLASLCQLPFYRNHAAELNNADVAALTKMLHTSWSTEYALRATAELGTDDFLKEALHWSLPQAYYSVFASLQAFLYTTGVRSNNAVLNRREASRMVVKNAYPRPASFYAAGAYGDVSAHRLPLQGYTSGLHVASAEITAQREVALLLLRTRKAHAQRVRLEVQENPNTAIRSQETGKPLTKWTAAHWQQITWRLGYTTVFDLLAVYQGAEGSTRAARLSPDLQDPRAFHVALVSIVSFLNGVHEAYVAKSIGGAAYAQLVDELPVHLQNGFVQERLEAIAMLQDCETQRAALAKMNR